MSRKQNRTCAAEPVLCTLDMKHDTTAFSKLPQWRKRVIYATDRFGVYALGFLEKFQTFAKQTVQREREGLLTSEDDIIRWATDYALDIIRFNLYYNELKEQDK